MRVPCTARRSNQFILKEINPGCSLKGLMLKLKLQYFGHLMQRTDSLKNILILEKIEGGKRRGWQRMRLLDSITDSMDMSLGELGVDDGQGGLACYSPRGCKESDIAEPPLEEEEEKNKKNVFYQLSILGNTLKKRKSSKLVTIV